MAHHLSILLWLPAAAALAVAALGPRRPHAIRVVAIGGAALTAALALPLWVAYQSRGAEWQFVESVQVLSSIGAGYLLGIDGFGLALILVTAIGGLAAVVAIGRAEHAAVPYVIVLAIECALFGVFMSLDLLLWFAFVIGVLAAATRFPRREETAEPPKARLWITMLVSSALVAAAVVSIWFSFHVQSGGYSFDLRLLRQSAIPSGAQIAAFVALFLGFAIAAAALIVRGAVALVALQSGVYALLRIGLPVLPNASRSFAVALMMLGIAGAFVAAILAVGQIERKPRGKAAWKRLAVHASVSQIFLALAGACALTPAGIRGSMMLASVPAFAGFFGARSTLEGIWAANRVAAVVGGASMALVGVAVVRICWRWLRDRERAPNPIGTARERFAVAALVAMALGVAVRPAPLLARIETSVARVVLRVSPQYAPDVADCLAPPPPPPAETGLPPGVVMAAPCVEGTQPGDPQKKGAERDLDRSKK